MILRRFYFGIILALALCVAPVLAIADTAFETSQIAVVTANGTFNLNVELALNPNQRAQGLMNRKEMASNAGMLFDFEHNEPVTMWMKNTLISLDMLFLDDLGTIVFIARNTQPGSLRHISPGRPVRGVLELNAGTAARLGIKRGNRVLHSRFGG